MTADAPRVLPHAGRHVGLREHQAGEGGDPREMAPQLVHRARHQAGKPGERRGQGGVRGGTGAVGQQLAQCKHRRQGDHADRGQLVAGRGQGRKSCRARERVEGGQRRDRGQRGAIAAGPR